MTAPANNSDKLKALLALTGLLALAALCYWPSLSGPFIFDDFHNLSGLGDYGGIDSWQKFLHYISSGNAGPLGRPVSLASFALNTQNWPADPYPFRLTNLALHLLNGLLVFILAGQVLATQAGRKPVLWLALSAMALWLLHPMLVSTTAFIVQRMTQLSCLFVLLGLIGYLHGRGQLENNPRKAWLWMLGSLGLGGGFAVLSKESGVLLPLFALCMEASIFAGKPQVSRSQQRMLKVLLALPVVLAATYIGSKALAPYAYVHREFSLGERLLTEARILVDYLARIFLPRMDGSGLYHDDFPVSSGLLDPPGTLAGILGLAALFCLGWLLRLRQPVVAFGIFWFFAGHVLESTIVPLELYYEHRNYLPMVGLAISASYLALGKSEVPRRAGILIVAFFIALESFITWQNAIIWGDHRLLAQITAAENPTSLRALERAAIVHAHDKDYEKTLQYLEQALEHHPGRNSLRLSIIQTKCLLGGLDRAEVRSVNERIAEGTYEKESIQYLPELTRLAALQICAGLDPQILHELLDAFTNQAERTTPSVPMHLIEYHRGNLLATELRFAEAMQAMDKAYNLRPNIDILLLQVVWLISIRDYEQAQRYLDRAREMDAQRRARSLSRKDDIQGFQGLIDRGANNPDYQPFAYPLTLSKEHS